MSVLPTWQGIPFHIKEDVVKLLDYTSRFRLRVCSKSDRDLVDSCPVILKQVELFATPHVHAPNFPHVLYINNSVKICHNVVDHFIGIFKHHKSIVKLLNVGFACAHRHQPPNAMATQLASKVDSLESTFRIRVKEIHSCGCFDEGCYQIFKILNPQAIVLIAIKSCWHQGASIPVHQLEAWKNAKHISIGAVYPNIPIDSFLHAERFRFFKSTLLAEEAWTLIKSFITRSHIRPGFGFRVNISKCLSEEQLMSKFEVEPRKVPLFQGSYYTPWLDSCYHFPTTDPELIFLLKTRKRNSLRSRHAQPSFLLYLEGIVCRKSNYNDFNQFRILTSWVPDPLCQKIHDNEPRAPRTYAPPIPLEQPIPQPSGPLDYFYYGPYLNVPPSIDRPSENFVVEIPVANVPTGPDDSLYVGKPGN